MNNSSSGLARGTVQIVPYDSQWIDTFAREKRRLQETFGDRVSVEHVGSTAVPGMPAKPIVDICMAIETLEEYVEFVPELERLGYQFMSERVFAEEVFMPKGPENKREVYLHIVQNGSDEHRRLLLFRDRLRSDSRLVADYAALKAELAARFPGDRKSYTSGKDAFIKSVLR